jgi:putative acetyltransferase
MIRAIREGDNAAMSCIIKRSLESYDLAIEGTAYTDPNTDRLFQMMQEHDPKSAYFILEKDTVVIGGVGIYPTSGLSSTTCELIRLFLIPAEKGKGLGFGLLSHAVTEARQRGYQYIYLETLSKLKEAIGLYTKYGFKMLKEPLLGDCGHNACDIWMLLQLD